MVVVVMMMMMCMFSTFFIVLHSTILLAASLCVYEKLHGLHKIKFHAQVTTNARRQKRYQVVIASNMLKSTKNLTENNRSNKKDFYIIILNAP